MLRRILCTLLLLLISAACSSPVNRLKPVVDVVSPPDGAQYLPGEPVSLRIAATSGNAITRIEVHSGSTLVASLDNPLRTVTLSTVVQYVPTQGGNVTLSIIAIDSTGQQSDPVILTLKIASGSGINNSSAGHDATSTDGTPVVTTVCKPNAVFVTDVTIPDNTNVTAGSKLVKTWRLRNTGQCAWESGYMLAFINGESMQAPENVTVAPTARDAAVDISVPFTAPAASGTYTSTWRMQGPDGNQFGNRVYMLIRVP